MPHGLEARLQVEQIPLGRWYTTREVATMIGLTFRNVTPEIQRLAHQTELLESRWATKGEEEAHGQAPGGSLMWRRIR